MVTILINSCSVAPTLSEKSARNDAMDSVSIQAVADLINASKGDEDNDSEEDTGLPTLTPAGIGPPKKPLTVKSSAYAKDPSLTSKDIWAPNEVSTEASELDDPRPAPKYDMLYKQIVKAEDVFLGMGSKNPSSACCEGLLVKIYLPKTPYKDIELDVTDTCLDCRTKLNYLGLHLPHKVDSKNARAKWNSDEEVLEILLPLHREYDFLNQ